MIRSIRDYIVKPPPIPAAYIDGFLYFCIAVFGAILAELVTDDSYKYWNPFLLYYTKVVCKIGLQGATALKMFRSTSYGDHLGAQAKLRQEDLVKIAAETTAETPTKT